MSTIKSNPAAQPTTTDLSTKRKDELSEAEAWLREHAAQIGSTSDEELRELSSYSASTRSGSSELDPDTLDRNSTALSIKPATYAGLVIATNEINRSNQPAPRADDSEEKGLIVKKESGKSSVLTAPISDIIGTDVVPDVLVQRIAEAYDIRHVEEHADDIGRGIRSIGNKFQLTRRE